MLRVLRVDVVADLERFPVCRCVSQHTGEEVSGQRGEGEDALLVLGRLPLGADLVRVLAQTRLLAPEAEVASVRLAARVRELVLLGERQVEEALVLRGGVKECESQLKLIARAPACTCRAVGRAPER